MLVLPPSETGDAVPPVKREGAGGRVLIFAKYYAVEILKRTPQILLRGSKRALAASSGLVPWSKPVKGTQQENFYPVWGIRGGFALLMLPPTLGKVGVTISNTA